MTFMKKKKHFYPHRKQHLCYCGIILKSDWDDVLLTRLTPVFSVINISEINHVTGNKYRCFVGLTAVVWENPWRLTDARHFLSSRKWELTAYLTSGSFYRPVLKTICKIKQVSESQHSVCQCYTFRMGVILKSHASHDSTHHIWHFGFLLSFLKFFFQIVHFTLIFFKILLLS